LIDSVNYVRVPEKVSLHMIKMIILCLSLVSFLAMHNESQAQTTKKMTTDTVELAGTLLTVFVNSLNRIYETEKNSANLSESKKRENLCADMGSGYGFAFSLNYLEMNTKELEGISRPAFLHERVLDMINNAADLRNNFCGSNELTEKDLSTKIEAGKKAAFEAAMIFNTLK